MIICGIKMTHDAAIAIAKDNKLIASVEMEKIQNNKRHSHMNDFSVITSVLDMFNLTLDDIDRLVIDGWKETTSGSDAICNHIAYSGQVLKVAKYNYALLNKPEETRYLGQGLQLNGKTYSYISYSHIYTHIAGTYATSPFSKTNESSYILVYDGGTKPIIYYFDSKTMTVEYVGEILHLGGDVYAGLACKLPPYNNYEHYKNGHYVINHDVAGKVMAYIALGTSNEKIKNIMTQIYDECLQLANTQENGFQGNRIFENRVVEELEGKFESADILASFHEFLEEKLITNLRSLINSHKNRSDNLCMCGGCSLNIKWNSAIRNSNIFDRIYISPFTNDSGSAIGAICAELITSRKITSLEWSVYCGQPVESAGTIKGWKSRSCSVAQLAHLLYTKREPVVVLDGRCESGPRALGSRSIMCDARSIKAKAILNKVKRREWYRPVAPICMEEYSKEYFIPGGSDKYMLFDHTANEQAQAKIPAIIHLDGTSRLQTITKDDDSVAYEILSEYKKLSGIPVLCNTSANKLGSGFFPDVKSAQEWGRCNYIWSNGVLYYKIFKNPFLKAR